MLVSECEGVSMCGCVSGGGGGGGGWIEVVGDIVQYSHMYHYNSPSEHNSCR